MVIGFSKISLSLVLQGYILFKNFSKIVVGLIL